MRALVTGAGGQVAKAWIAAAPPTWTVTALSRLDLDIGDEAAVQAAVARARPDVVLNAAAFTAVDLAESQANAAWRVNRDGAGHLARAAAHLGARMVQLSTDFVFNGQTGTPYAPDAATAPLNVYGASKLAGEAAVLEAAPGALIVRTAWVYSGHGANFLTRMLGLMAKGGEVRVVCDQIGAPTSAATLAAALWRLIEREAQGVMHFTDAGVASWYDFAQAIGEEAFALGLLPGLPCVAPIAARDFRAAARRPAFSVLDKTLTWAILEGPPRHWRVALRDVLATMRSGGR
jgi:dTDP-4-dehydrorhamnose reductase